MSGVVVAFGGNAFAPANGPTTMEGQIEFAHRAAEQLVPLLQEENRLLISHGNGPQVGHMLRRVESALGASYRLPLDVCVAETEGELGFVLGQALRNIGAANHVTRQVISILTQVEVDADDVGFSQFTKPIGPFLDSQQAEQMRAAGAQIGGEGPRGYRRLVASPKPRRVVEIDSIRVLLDAGHVVIAAGGGGIPVVHQNGKWLGVEAVIDKDWTAALIADQLEADTLLIVTCVPFAYLHFGTDHQEPIMHCTRKELERWLAAGHFAAGSMRPKVEAVLQFTFRPARRAIICNLGSLPAALAGDAGTIVKSDETVRSYQGETSSP